MFPLFSSVSDTSQPLHVSPLLPYSRSPCLVLSRLICLPSLAPFPVAFVLCVFPLISQSACLVPCYSFFFSCTPPPDLLPLLFCLSLRKSISTSSLNPFTSLSALSASIAICFCLHPLIFPPSHSVSPSARSACRPTNPFIHYPIVLPTCIHLPPFHRLGITSAKGDIPQRWNPSAGFADMRTIERGPHGFPLCRFCKTETSGSRKTFCSPGCVHEHKVSKTPLDTSSVQ